MKLYEARHVIKNLAGNNWPQLAANMIEPSEK